MFNLAHLTAVSPELLLSSTPLPPPRGPMRLSLASYGERDAAAVLGECFARVGYRYEMERVAGTPFRAELALNLLPGAMVAEGILHGSRNRRRHGIIDDRADEAVMMVNIAGPHLVEQFGKELVLHDGEAVLLSGTDPSCFTHRPPGHMLGLRIPKSVLAPMLKSRDVPFMRRVPRESAALRHLVDYVGLTWRAPHATDALTVAMGQHIQHLVALTVGASADTDAEAQDGALRVTRLHRLRQQIAQALEDPAFSVAELAELNRCSPRAIQRLFESEGTSFTAVLLQERLQAARNRLTDPAFRREKIASIAFDCGFGDISYFNRAFRKEFGMTPGDVREGRMA